MNWDFTWLDYLLFAGSLQGLVLAILIHSIRENNSSANIYLELLMIVNAIFIFGRAFWGKPIVGHFPLLILSLDVALFFYAPLIFCYFKSLFSQKRDKKDLYHFIPGLLFIGIINPFMESNFYRLRIDLNMQELLTFWQIIEGFALIYSIIYTYKAYNILKQNTSVSISESYVSYTSAFIKLTIFGLLFWLCTFILRFTPLQFLGSVQGYSITWLYLVVISYLLGYYVINFGEVFRVIKSTQKYTGLNVSPEIQQKILDKLENLMSVDKPFLNPELTIGGLSKMVGIRSNVLSMLINDRMQKNFYDYINFYRIKEFERMVKSDQYENITLEGIARESGFRSKSAFHKYFRKFHNNVTPSQYLKSTKPGNGE